MRLKDRVAIVTGAARGIGQVFSIALAKEGARVVAADIQPMDDTIAKVKETGNEIAFAVTDVSSTESTKEMVAKTLEIYRQIDILVCNAGILTGMKHYDEITEEEWDRVMAVNAKGMWQCAKAVLPVMREQKKGKIIKYSFHFFFTGRTPGRPLRGIERGRYRVYTFTGKGAGRYGD